MSETRIESSSNESEGDSSASSRRGFIGCISVAGAATALDQSGTVLAGQRTEKQLTAAHFSKHVGEWFQMSGEGYESHSIKLSSVESHPRGDRPSHCRDPFSIVFRASSRTVVRQAIRSVRNSRFGAIEALVVPVGIDGDDRLYQVVFS